MLCVLRLYHWFILMRQGILTKIIWIQIEGNEEGWQNVYHKRPPERRAFNVTQQREDLVVFAIFVIAQWHDKHIDMHGIDQLAR